MRLLISDANILIDMEAGALMETIGLLCAMVKNRLLSVDDAFVALNKMKEGNRRLPWAKAESRLNALR